MRSIDWVAINHPGGEIEHDQSEYYWCYRIYGV